MRSTYSATFKNCRFSNFNEGGHSAFRAQKGTMADELRFENCSFDHISGNAIFLGAETDNRGTYNAEIIVVQDCKFFNILGSAINVYRGGSDESTTGPQLTVKGSIFEDVNNAERGSVIIAWGTQVVTIENNQFMGSGRGGCVIRFDEAAHDVIQVGNNNSYNSGRICSFYGNVVKGTITNNPPTRSIKDEL
jgi:poly(beta-D-mannuronate) lyase